MSNLNSKDRKAISAIVVHMEQNGIPKSMFSSKMAKSICRKRLYKTYVENMNFTSKQLTAAILVYNRKHGKAID